MLLQSLELQGYKTFAGKTGFLFADQITAIVGPNGSGKSNIADSIRWVLGEQSYSLLRGKKTIDMIFSGSENKARAGMASATITFNNESNWLPIDFSEVAITRRAYRDGQNEYLINNQKVRLRDVSELLGNSGLSQRTYTVIGQGLVDAALALKAEDRRKLFEEAAGIGLYRSRREEAYRRLDTTKRNLTRINDILSELRPRLRSLEKQAERTRKYEQIRKDLQVLLREWYGYQWYRAQDRLEKAIDNLENRQAAFQQVTEEHVQVEALLLEHRSRIQELRSQLNAWHHQISILHRQREDISVNLAVTDERIRSNVRSQENIETRVARIEQELKGFQERLAGNLLEKSTTQDAFTEIAQELTAAENHLRELEEKERQIALQRTKLQNRRSQVLQRISEYNVQLEERAKSKANNLNQISELEGQVATLYEQGKMITAEIDSLEKRLQVLNEAKQKLLQRIEAQKAEIDEFQAKQNELNQSIQAYDHDLSRTDALIQAIENAEASMVGYAEGAKRLLELAAKRPDFGKLLPLIQSLEVPQEIEVAITAALGEYKDAVLLEDGQRLDAYLDDLSESGKRGTILPVQGAIPPSSAGISGGQPGVLGIASDLVKTSTQYRLAVDALLNQVIVVRDRETAKRVLKSAGENIRIVTLNGEIFHARGLVQAGVGSELATVRRPREKQELTRHKHGIQTKKAAAQREADQVGASLAQSRQHLAEIESELGELRESETQLRDQVNQLKLNWTENQRNQTFYTRQIDKLHDDNLQIDANSEELENAKQRGHQEARDLQNDLEKIQTEIDFHGKDDLQGKINHWRTQKALFEEKIAGISQRVDEFHIRINELGSELSGSRQRKDEIVTDQEKMQTALADFRQREATLLAQVEEYQSKIDPAEAELTELENQLSVVQKKEDITRHGLNQAERMVGQAQLEHSRRQEAIESMRERIDDDLGLVEFEYSESVSGPTPLPFDGIVERLPKVEVLAEGLEQEVKRQKAQLRRTGPINPEAEKEFAEVQERYNFMLEQIADLDTAEQDICQVIAELDALMERDFLATFEAVAVEFEDIFKRLFGGGSAKLVLIDPDDLTETGIDIEARLPGRRAQGLSLLSGGERSLTATSLVFSLLKVSPTPFCVLDEVDAMLDEANVGRFRELLKELSQNTQFIIITHNRNTVQAAEVIYGITMGKDSTSQVISLKLDQFEEVMEDYDKI